MADTLPISPTQVSSRRRLYTGQYNPITAPTGYYENSSDTKTRKQWAQLNRNYGFWSFALASGAVALRFADSVINSDSKVLSFFGEVALRTRGNLQYGIYEQGADDKGFDLGANSRTDRPLAANVGTLACFIERFINPIILPLSCLGLEKNIHKGIVLLTTLPNNLWWRIRAASEGTITLKNINKLFESAKDIFHSDLNKREKARLAVTKVNTPLMGLVGLVTMAIATPLQAIYRILGKESKLVDVLAAVPFFTQHLVYFFKYTMDDFNKAEYYSRKGDKDKASDYKTSAYIGTSANAMNILLPFAQMFAGESNVLKNLSDFIPTMVYFANRRKFRGEHEIDRLADEKRNRLSEAESGASGTAADTSASETASGTSGTGSTTRRAIKIRRSSQSSKSKRKRDAA